MRFAFTTSRTTAVCNETRSRRHGYLLRCLEPPGHTGDHRWTPELADDVGDARRPPRVLLSIDRRVRSAIAGRRSG
jgi:hypothetical protein